MRRILVTVSCVLAVALVAGGVTTFVAYRKLDNNVTSDDVSAKLGTDRPSAAPENEDGQKPLNILLIGSDDRGGGNARLGGGREDGQRSDTTILLHVAGDRRHATAISFPRDTLVDVPPCVLPSGQRSRPQHLAMFNSAFSVGGTACTIKTVEKLTDIRVDHHVVVDFRGFAAIVNALGGVQICLPTGVNDREGNIRLAAGRRTVRGAEALDYVRLRHDRSLGGNGGDLGRIKRQQAFLSALATKAKSTGVLLNPPKLFGLLDAATKPLTTDPGLDSLSELAKLARSLRRLETRNIEFVTVPVHDYPLDKNRLEVTQPVADQLFAAVRRDEPITRPAAGTEPPASPSPSPSASATPTGSTLTVAPAQVSVRVLNGSGTPGRAKRVADELRRQGFRVVSLGTSERIFSQTLVRYPFSRRSAARTVQAAAPGSILKPATDGSAMVTLVVGKDFDASQVARVTVGSRAGTATDGNRTTPTAPPRLETRTADKDICG